MQLDLAVLWLHVAHQVLNGKLVCNVNVQWFKSISCLGPIHLQQTRSIRHVTHQLCEVLHRQMLTSLHEGSMSSQATGNA